MQNAHAKTRTHVARSRWSKRAASRARACTGSKSSKNCWRCRKDGVWSQLSNKLKYDGADKGAAWEELRAPDMVRAGPRADSISGSFFSITLFKQICSCLCAHAKTPTHVARRRLPRSRRTASSARACTGSRSPTRSSTPGGRATAALSGLRRRWIRRLRRTKRLARREQGRWGIRRRALAAPTARPRPRRGRRKGGAGVREGLGRSNDNNKSCFNTISCCAMRNVERACACAWKIDSWALGKSATAAWKSKS